MENVIRLKERSLTFCFLVLAALTCVAIALELGLWVHGETFTAPFAVSSSGTYVVPVWGGKDSSFFWVRSDSDGGDANSDLRAWINGTELPPHSNITEIMNGFSHWGDFVYFNRMMASHSDSTLHIRYSIRVRPWVLYTIIILLLLYSWRTASSTYVGFCIVTAHKFFLVVLIMCIIFLVLLALLAAASAIAGLIAGTGLYPIYAYERLYNIWPSLKSLIWIEPHLPLLLISLSLAITGSSWLLGRVIPAHQEQARLDELKAVNTWINWGLPAILGLLLTSVILGAWSGNVTQLDLPYMNVAGLVPNSDPMGYFAEALNLFHVGQASQFGARRMLATILLGWISFLAQGSYVTITVVQSILVAAGIYIAAAAVLRWRGIAASLCFVAFSYIIVRPFVVTTLTEAAAASIAFLAVPFFVYGLLHNSNMRLLLGFALINVAMLIRPGGIFCLPAFVVWALFASKGPFSRRLKFASASAAVGCGAFLLNTAMTRFFCPDATPVDVALPYLLCGLSLGTTYHQCEAQYAIELSHLGSEAAQAAFLYAAAWKNILANPQIFLSTVLRTGVQFLTDLPKLLFRGYTTWRLDVYFPILLVYGFSCLGWLAAARRQFDFSLVALVALFFLGNLASAAFLYISDGWRVFIVSYPLFAALVAGGLCSQQSVQTWSRVRLHRLGHLVAVLTFSAAVLLFGPTAIARYRLAVGRSPDVPLSPGEVLISRQRPLVGFLVVPDSMEPSSKIPSIQISLFRRFLEAGQFLPQLSMERFPKAPFGFIFPAQMPLHHVIYDNVVVPSEVILREDVPAWKLRVAPFNEPQQWIRAIEAAPAP